MKSYHDAQAFVKHLKDQKDTLIVEFWMEKCKPCKELTPLLDELSKTIQIVKFEVNRMDQDSTTDDDLMEFFPLFKNADNKLVSYWTAGLPCLVMIRNGKIIKHASFTHVSTAEKLKSWVFV